MKCCTMYENDKKEWEKYEENAKARLFLHNLPSNFAQWINFERREEKTYSLALKFAIVHSLRPALKISLQICFVIAELIGL